MKIARTFNGSHGYPMRRKRRPAMPPAICILSRFGLPVCMPMLVALNVNVTYAKHAISIDEDRKDFQRVPWIPDASKATTRDASGNLHFEQVWFAGVHADVGGGYPENESRLSDITLQWMLSAAALVPDGLKYDRRVLKLSPEPAGPQHDEGKAGHWQRGIRDLPTAPERRPAGQSCTDQSMPGSRHLRFCSTIGLVNTGRPI